VPCRLDVFGISVIYHGATAGPGVRRPPGPARSGIWHWGEFFDILSPGFLLVERADVIARLPPDMGDGNCGGIGVDDGLPVLFVLQNLRIATSKVIGAAPETPP